MIVKDDAELDGLKQALRSAQPYVDCVYITTTGTEVEKIKEIPDVEHSHLDWCDDFSKTRNFNFSQAPQDSDYIFWMDSDDVLVGGENLRKIAETAQENGKDIVFFTYWYGCGFDEQGNMTEVLMEHMRERLLKPGVTTWKKRLHETPVPVSGIQENYTAFPYNPKHMPIAIMHTSRDEELPEKMERNKRILEMELEEETQAGTPDPRTQLYLMKIYAEQDEPQNWKKVIALNEEYQKKSGWDEERGTAWEQVGIVYGKMGNFKQVVESLHKSIQEWAHQPLLYIRLATAYFNLNNFKAAKHWLDLASSMDLDNKGSNITNLKAMKVMYAQLLLKLNYNYKRDTKKALEAAKLLFKEDPTKQNEEQVLFLEDLNDLNEACKNFDHLARYLHSIGEEKTILPLLNALPSGISTQPFAIKLRNEVSEPRKWGKNEICYFANFGGKHFEPWSGKSLIKGIGGSETAVIELSKEWTKLGYKVTVFGDPQAERGEIEGVTYLPWYEFNKKDEFNIFIQWRDASLAGKIKVKKFLVDLHDVFSGLDYPPERLEHIDKVMLKSEYHRKLAPQIPDEKVQIISNGIRAWKTSNSFTAQAMTED